MTLSPKLSHELKAVAPAGIPAAREPSGFVSTAVASVESPSRLGPPLVYTTESQVTLQRPDKLRVITPYDGPPTEFFYNGKSMTAYAPDKNLAAVAKAPPTIDEALKAAYDEAGIYFPFANMISADPYKHVSDGPEYHDAQRLLQKILATEKKALDKAPITLELM
jgi:hypothetical protein